MKLIVVGGYPRSGTSILSAVLRNSKNGVGFNFESRIFTNFCRFLRPEKIELDSKWLDVRRNLSKKVPYEHRWLHPVHDEATFVSEMVSRSWHRTEKLGLKNFLDFSEAEFVGRLESLCADLSDGGADARYSVAASFIESLLGECRGFGEAEYMVEKTPANLLYTRDVLRLFPEVKFIWIYRHPLDSLASVKNRWGTHYDMCHITWFETGLSLEAELPRERFRSVKFENLVADPQGVLADLSDWAGMSLDRCPMERLSQAKSNIGRYSNDLTDAEMSVFEMMGTRRLMTRLGYE